MTIAEFRQELIDKRSYFYQFPWPATTYGHWSAGRYFTTFNDYHFNVDGDGEIIYTRPLDEVPRATYHRNTGSIAIALCCCYFVAADANWHNALKSPLVSIGVLKRNYTLCSGQ